MMEWAKLLSRQRTGQDSSSDNDNMIDRNDFERDYDRIVFSPAFRRLQGKTQVIPIPETDFVHTRLTHSVEVSCVGRSLGKIIGEKLIKKEPATFEQINIHASHFGALVAAACLAHDIGNPPFGHSGEQSISDYFKSTAAEKYITRLTEKQIADLQRYEGNASGFRLLSYTYPAISALQGGLGLTYATLGSFSKYPKESLPHADTKKASEKKFGFFQSEKSIFTSLADELGLIPNGNNENKQWKRHPLAFVMEAADDICYRIIDLEDGYKLNMLTFKEIEELLFLDTLNEKGKRTYDSIHDNDEKIGYLRAKAISRLITEAADAFEKNYDEIMDGSFDAALIKDIPSRPQLNAIQEISVKRIYQSKAVLEIEAAGFEVLGGLMEIFIEAVLGNKSGRNEKIRMLIPAHYTKEEDIATQDGLYRVLLNISEFVSSMTDNSAISLYRKMKGISLPRI